MGKDQEPKSACKIPIRPRKKGHPEEEPATEETPELWVPPGFRETDAVPSRPKKHGTIPGKESVSMERRNRRKAGKDTEKTTKNPRRRFHRSRKIAIASGVVAGFFLFWLASLLLPDKTQTPNPYPDPLKSKAAGQEQSRLFENALEQLRMGNSEEALQTLQQLEKTNPLLPSLSYHIALAALQYGDTSLAGKNADASIAKRERIADSLALKAVIETQKNRSGSLGDPAAAAEALLRQAASIEPGNPSPLIELSTILRHKSDHDGALELLKSRPQPTQPRGQSCRGGYHHPASGTSGPRRQQSADRSRSRQRHTRPFFRRLCRHARRPLRRCRVASCHCKKTPPSRFVSLFGQRSGPSPVQGPTGNPRVF